MANAERLTVSVPLELAERMRAAGISPSALLASALRHELGDDTQPSAADRLVALEKLTTDLRRRVNRLEKSR